MSGSTAATAPRIALVHALAHSIEPVNAAFTRDWPAARRMNLFDDSLSADLAASASGLDAAMHDRFQSLAAYALGTGAQAILFTCSAFGPCIEAVARRHPGMPVLKPNEAMVREAVARLAQGAEVGRLGRLGLLATFAPTLASMPAEFPADAQLELELADGALDALDAGNTAAHDAAVVQAALRLQARGCTVIALAQFSLARAARAVQAATGLPVLTTVDSAVAELRRRLSPAP